MNASLPPATPIYTLIHGFNPLSSSPSRFHEITFEDLVKGLLNFKEIKLLPSSPHCKELNLTLFLNRDVEFLLLLIRFQE